MARAGRFRHLPEAAGAGAGGTGAVHRLRFVSGAWPARHVRAGFRPESGGDTARSGMVTHGRQLHPALSDLRDHRAAGGSGERDEAVGMNVGVDLNRPSISMRSLTTLSQL